MKCLVIFTTSMIYYKQESCDGKLRNPDRIEKKICSNLLEIISVGGAVFIEVLLFCNILSERTNLCTASFVVIINPNRIIVWLSA